MEDNPNSKNKKDIKDKDNKYRRIIIIFFAILSILLIVFFILFFLIKCNGDKNNSNSEEPDIVSVEEKDYINFYNYIKKVSNEYIEDNFLKTNYVSYVNAISYESNSLCYTGVNSSNDELAFFSISITSGISSLEEVIKTYNNNELDLSGYATEVELYSKNEEIERKAFKGISKVDPDKHIYSVTYKENNEYISGVNLFDNEENLTYSNKTTGNASTPLTYSLYKFMLSI